MGEKMTIDSVQTAVKNLISAMWNVDDLRNKCRNDLDVLREWLRGDFTVDGSGYFHFHQTKEPEVRCKLCDKIEPHGHLRGRSTPHLATPAQTVDVDFEVTG